MAQLGAILEPDAEVKSTTNILAQDPSTEASVERYNSSTLEGWQIGLVIIVALGCLLAAAAATVWCVTHKRKHNHKRQEFNERLTKYYDSISIDENLSKLNYDMFNSDSEGASTVSTQVSTPMSNRPENPLASLYEQSFKISNGKLPSIHFHSEYKFSLEDTMKKLQELDNDDNIAQIRNTYRYFGYMDDSIDEEVLPEDTTKYSPRFRYFEEDKALIMDTLPFTDSTHL